MRLLSALMEPWTLSVPVALERCLALMAHLKKISNSMCSRKNCKKSGWRPRRLNFGRFAKSCLFLESMFSNRPKNEIKALRIKICVAELRAGIFMKKKLKKKCQLSTKSTRPKITEIFLWQLATGHHIKISITSIPQYL